MQVFKLYFRLLKKYKGSLFFYGGIFLVVSLVLSGAISSDGETRFESTKLKVGIVNKSEGILGKEVIRYFEKVHKMIPVQMEEQELVNELYWKRLDYVLVIPEAIEEGLASGKEELQLQCIKVPGVYANELFETEISMYTKKLHALVLSGYTMEEATRELYDAKVKDIAIQVTDFVNENQNDRISWFLVFVPYFFISVAITGIGTILLVFHQKEVKERMECSATSLRERTAGLVAGILLFGAILYAVILILSIILSKATFLTDIRTPYFLLNVFVILLFSLSLGFFVGVVAKTHGAIVGMNNILGIALCMLGGIFVPMEFMGETVQKIAKYLPTYWYVRSTEMISSMVEVTAEFQREIWLQSIFIICCAVAVFAITMLIYTGKRRKTA